MNFKKEILRYTQNDSERCRSAQNVILSKAKNLFFNALFHKLGERCDITVFDTGDEVELGGDTGA